MIANGLECRRCQTLSIAPRMRAHVAEHHDAHAWVWDPEEIRDEFRVPAGQGTRRVVRHLGPSPRTPA